MVARARERADAAGLGHARFAVADAQTDDVGTDHDAVISRFGIMFFDDPVAAFAHLAESARPGGRLAALAWTPAAEQEWVTGVLGAALAHVPIPDLGAPGAPGPFALADPDRARAILTEAGWSGVTLDRHTRTQYFAGTTSLDEAMEYAETGGPGRALLAGAPDDATRARALDAVRAFLAERATPEGFPITGNAWLLTAHRP
jgi:SAM-dependent methyltransferase